MLDNLDYYHHKCPPISDFDPACPSGHFAVPRNINFRKSKSGKWFAIIELIDTNNILTKIRIWNIKPKEVEEEVIVNELYQIKNAQYSDSWGYSQRGLRLWVKEEEEWIDKGPNWIRKTTNANTKK